MKNKHNTCLSMLIGDLWIPKPDVMSQIQEQYNLPKVKLISINEANNTTSIMNLKIESPTIPLSVNNSLSKQPPSIEPRISAPKIIPEQHVNEQATSINEKNKSPGAIQVGLIDNWQQLQHLVINCQDCKLCNGRKNVVLERGNRNARWMLVGEGPGEHEDIQGKPFVGASGQLLDKMITAMKLDPATDVYIANVVKCRPPHNRNPAPEEISSCKNYLFSQIELVKPNIIITLGRFAMQTILDTELAVGKLRNKINYYKGIPVIATYHPSYLLRTPDAKKDAWSDLQLAMKTFTESSKNI